MIRTCSVFAALTAVACITDDPGIITTPGDTGLQGDNTPPEIVHEAIETSQIYGQPVRLEAQVTDTEGTVFVVQVFYRQETSSMWEVATLMDLEGQGFYEGQIPGADVITGGMYYYLYAMDSSENEAFEPPEGEDDAFHFRISPDE